MANLNNYVVIKLGGTSQTKEGYDNLVTELEKYQNHKIIVVVSAVKNVTNFAINFINSKSVNDQKNIIEFNKKLCDDLSLSYDCINMAINKFIDITSKNLSCQNKIDLISFGETFTANILNTYLNMKSLKSIYLDSTEIIHSNVNNSEDSFYNKGNFIVNNFKLMNLLNENDIVIVPGFRASTPNKEICLMGRGGSDTTGSIIAASIKAEQYMIWTDVNGIFSGDPNIVENVNIIPTISYNAAQEISAMGAKVIHPYCIKPCMEAEVPIHIRNIL